MPACLGRDLQSGRARFGHIQIIPHESHNSGLHCGNQRYQTWAFQQQEFVAAVEVMLKVSMRALRAKSRSRSFQCPEGTLAKLMSLTGSPKEDVPLGTPNCGSAHPEGGWKSQETLLQAEAAQACCLLWKRRSGFGGWDSGWKEVEGRSEEKVLGLSKNTRTMKLF